MILICVCGSDGNWKYICRFASPPDRISFRNETSSEPEHSPNVVRFYTLALWLVFWNYLSKPRQENFRFSYYSSYVSPFIETRQLNTHYRSVSAICKLPRIVQHRHMPYDNKVISRE